MKAGKDPERLAWIRTLPCAIQGLHECRGPIDAHHRQGHKGIGQKNADDQVLPLCRHGHIHERHKLVGYFEGWEKAQIKAWEAEMVEKYQDMYTAHTIGPSG